MCVVVNGNSSIGAAAALRRRGNLYFSRHPEQNQRERERAQSNSEHALTFPPQRSYYLPVCKQSISYFATRTSLIVARGEIIYTAAAARLGGPVGKIDASFVPITRSKMRLPFKSARRARGPSPINEFCTGDN
jgi:hypothetical protein